MKLIICFVIFIPMLLFPSCNGGSTNQKLLERTYTSGQYSTMFSISENRKVVTITYPEHKTIHIVFDAFGSNDIERNDTIFITSQPKKVVCTSTTFLGFLKIINETASLVGFQNKNLVYDSVIYSKLLQNQIVDVSTPEGLNNEMLISMQPDIVFMTYSPGNDKSSTIERLKNNGIIVIQIPDWLEQHPLGRMEWVVFFSLFYNKYDVAKKYSNSVITSYNDIKLKGMTKSYTPKVMIGLSFNEQWFVPSGNGYFGTLLQDAGFMYPFQSKKSSQSLAFSKEEVLSQCYDADIWLNVTTATSLKDMELIERLAPQFKSFQQKNVFNYTKKLLPRGANDFWEMGVVEPHLVLKDLESIASGQYKNQQTTFYKRLQ